MKKDFSESNDSFDMGQLVEKVSNIDIKTDRIEQKLEMHYVTQDQFEPVKRIVYGLVGVVLLTVAAAIMAIILKK